MSHYLGIDVGATHLRAAVATDDLSIVGRSVGKTPQNASDGSVPGKMIETVEAACDAAGIDSDAIAAVGVGSIGPIDRDAGTIVDPVNVSVETDRIRLVHPLREFLATDRICLHNDAICGVVGERYFVESAIDNMAYLTMSTGIGAGIVVDGDVIFGDEGNAGEVGHMTIDPSETMTCQCGAGGHWEAYCGGANIPRYAAYHRRERSVETTLPVDDEEFTAKDVFEGTDEDELADLVVERIGRWNAIGFANIVQTFAPEYVAVGGAVALNNPDAILDPIRRRVPNHVMIDPPEIELTELGEEVVLKGALVLARFQSTSTRMSNE